MSSPGSDLLAFVREIRALCSQLADLLGTADKLMAEEGWERATLQNVAHASSSSIDQPKNWFPREVCRFYKHGENRQIIAFVSVLLDDDRKGEYQIAEPLLTAGWFVFSGAAPDVIPGDKLWWSRFHGYMKPRRDDGTVMSVCPREEWPEGYRPAWHPFERAFTFAVPLADITDTSILGDRVLKPLLARLRESSATPHL